MAGFRVENASQFVPWADFTAAGPFYMVLRLYQPRPELLKGEHQPPEVVQGK